MQLLKLRTLGGVRICLPLLGVVPEAGASTSTLEVFHADSLAGPMRAIKAAFEVKVPGIKVRLSSGVSRQLAARILNGDACDVFAPSSPAVIEEELMRKTVANSGKVAATWYVVFSANEMVIITAKGNPLGIRRASDLLQAGLRFVRVTGHQDLATGRSIEFLMRATAQEGRPVLAQQIVDSAAAAAGKETTVPDAVSAERQGAADAGVVYYSAAMEAGNDVSIVRFADNINMSETIRNAAVVPDTARLPAQATEFVSFLLSTEGQAILKETGQPPVVPAIRHGAVPAQIR